MADDHRTRSAQKPGNNPATQMRLHPDFTPTRAPTAAETAPTAAETSSAAAGETEPLETGTVARGRSIEVPDLSQPLRERHSCGEGGIVNTSTFQPCRRYLPGEEVTLPASEIKRLRELGFIVDPDAVEPVAMPLQQTERVVGPEPRSKA